MVNTPPAPQSSLAPPPRWPVFQHEWAAYGTALALTGLALVVRLHLDPVMGNSGRLVFFMIAATISAFVCGRGPGLLSTLLGCALGDYFFFPPRLSFAVANTALGIGLAATCLQGVIVSFCAGALHRALKIRATAEAETRRLYESELAAREAAAELNRTKDYFLAVLSHELRGPLSAIQYCVADRLADPEVPRELRDDLALIERNAQMQSRLISDLLDLTRLTRGKMEIESRPLDLHLLLLEAVRTCGTPSEARESPIPTIHLHAGQPWVQGDRDRLLQVFWNVLRNAGKFTSRDGLIEVETFEPAPGHIAVRIRDTGVGLTPDALARIFQPFEQAAHDSSGKKHGGLGLGLAIARGIVELHGGTLTGQSDGPGHGAAFIVELPTTDRPASQVSARHSGVGRPTRSGAAHPSASVA